MPPTVHMYRISKLRRRAPAVALVVLVAGGALGLLAPYLSNVVNREMAIVVPSVSLAVDGIPANASAGDILTILANLTNNANRPTPAVLRFEVRNPDGIGPAEITVHGVCGAEEIVSSKTLRYYIGSHGPLLAPNGTAFANGTRVSAVDEALGPRGHWGAVLAEVKQRDPTGYAALVEPGTNATDGIRGTSSLALKALFYYSMVQGDDLTSKDPEKWTLKLPFASRVTIPVSSAAGFQVEISLNGTGSYSFRLWVERPDGLGVPNHPWKCGPL